MLRLHGAYDRRLLGHGPEKYKVVATASFRLFALVAIVSYVMRLDVARGYVAMAMPTGMIGLLVAPWLWQKSLTMHRAQGLMSGAVLVVGDREHLTGLIRALNSVPEAGYRVVAACCGDAEHGYIGRVPVLGDESEAAEVAQRIGAITVACSSSQRFDAGRLRRLGWALEGQEVDLVVVPRLTDVAGPPGPYPPGCRSVLAPRGSARIRGSTACGQNRHRSDRSNSTPDRAVTAVRRGLRSDQPRPQGARVLSAGAHRQRWHLVPMLKFRTMQVGAEAMLTSLKDRSEGQGPLFKLRDDPRITRIGSKLRRYSLDELPQLVNVLRGQMSLVGPRPPLPCEVETYGYDVRRRLLVKPGMTGLWQINGRSELSWDEAVRFDLYYVENWSVMSDLIILWRTWRAVLQASGAY
jgi:hypothetical protein